VQNGNKDQQNSDQNEQDKIGTSQQEHGVQGDKQNKDIQASKSQSVVQAAITTTQQVQSSGKNTEGLIDMQTDTGTEVPNGKTDVIPIIQMITPKSQTTQS
jgi:hypothetical protein